ncbi:hypothetical protein EXIGLDRAFT_745473 [Exidia glandulosa HHB12029]|uniref:Uncharacterized protein n=1 Tax=Exidia glandulosa HHB12029 TaxID=1314781 RepID=A0A165NEK3_EXIGL|nr:hypothetical protein EXIGLDRAFT_745473 [Exidia glandulosa HHB12029]
MSLLIALALSSTAVALDYSYSAPTQCDPFTVRYSDGEPPFTLQLSVGFGNPTIVKLPDDAWNGNKGSYTIEQLSVAAGKEFIMTLYDKSGFVKGVNSPVLSVGSSLTNKTCDTTDKSPDFTYGAPDALTQCLNYRFTDYGTATKPITVNGIIAGGSIFQRTSQPTDEEFLTQVDIHAGTRLIFWMQDAKGRSGGATEILSVLNSPDATCIKPSSPGTTQGATPSQIPAGSDGGASTGAIAAAVIGTLIAFVAIGAFIFMRRRRQRSRNSGGVIADPYVAGHSRQSSRFSRRTPSVDLLSASRSGYERTPGFSTPTTPSRSFNGHPPFPNSTSGGETGRAHEGAFDSDPSLTPDPFLGEPTPRTPSSFASQQQQQQQGGPVPSRRSSTSKAPYGASGRPTYGQPRFILHTDAGALEEHPQEEADIVELPPMYVDTRSTASREALASAASGSGSGKQRIPPPPPIPDDDHAHRPISYNSAVSFPRGPRTERTMSFGATSTVAEEYDDPVLERSVSQRQHSSYAESSSHRAMSSDGSQRPLRMHNPDEDDEDEDEEHNQAGGSSHPQYDFLDDVYDRTEDSADDGVQLAYASSSQDGPQHPLASGPGPSSRPEPTRTNSMRPVPARQDSANAPHAR